MADSSTSGELPVRSRGNRRPRRRRPSSSSSLSSSSGHGDRLQHNSSSKDKRFNFSLALESLTNPIDYVCSPTHASLDYQEAVDKFNTLQEQNHGERAELPNESSNESPTATFEAALKKIKTPQSSFDEMDAKKIPVGSRSVGVAEHNNPYETVVQNYTNDEKASEDNDNVTSSRQTLSPTNESLTYPFLSIFDASDGLSSSSSPEQVECPEARPKIQALPTMPHPIPQLPSLSDTLSSGSPCSDSDNSSKQQDHYPRRHAEANAESHSASRDDSEKPKDSEFFKSESSPPPDLGVPPEQECMQDQEPVSLESTARIQKDQLPSKTHSRKTMKLSRQNKSESEAASKAERKTVGRDLVGSDEDTTDSHIGSPSDDSSQFTETQDTNENRDESQSTDRMKEPIPREEMDTIQGLKASQTTLRMKERVPRVTRSSRVENKKLAGEENFKVGTSNSRMLDEASENRMLRLMEQEHDGSINSDQYSFEGAEDPNADRMLWPIEEETPKLQSALVTFAEQDSFNWRSMMEEDVDDEEELLGSRYRNRTKSLLLPIPSLRDDLSDSSPDKSDGNGSPCTTPTVEETMGNDSCCHSTTNLGDESPSPDHGSFSRHRRRTDSRTLLLPVPSLREDDSPRHEKECEPGNEEVVEMTEDAEDDICTNEVPHHNSDTLEESDEEESIEIPFMDSVVARHNERAVLADIREDPDPDLVASLNNKIERLMIESHQQKNHIASLRRAHDARATPFRDSLEEARLWKQKSTELEQRLLRQGRQIQEIQTETCRALQQAVKKTTLLESDLKESEQKYEEAEQQRRMLLRRLSESQKSHRRLVAADKERRQLLSKLEKAEKAQLVLETTKKENELLRSRLSKSEREKRLYQTKLKQSRKK